MYVCRVALALLDLYKVSVSSRVADVDDFRADMKCFVQSVARHCTTEKLLERAFQIPIATRNELNLLFKANKDALMQKGVTTHQRYFYICIIIVCLWNHVGNNILCSLYICCS